MTVALRTQPQAPIRIESAPPIEKLHRFTVRQFQLMIDEGVFRPGERLELLDGLIFEKMTQKPLHAVVLDLAHTALATLLPAEWYVREQKPIQAQKSLPEPDLVVVRSPATRYARKHPGAGDIAILIEVADTSLEFDRSIKGAVYARSKIAEYWIINLLDRTVEVHTRPRGGKSAGYELQTVHAGSDLIPVAVQGKELGMLALTDFLPREIFHEG